MFMSGGGGGVNNNLTPQQRRQKSFASSHEQRNTMAALTSRDEFSMDKSDRDARAQTARNRFLTLSGSESTGSNQQQQRFSSLRTSKKGQVR